MMVQCRDIKSLLASLLFVGVLVLAELAVIAVEVSSQLNQILERMGPKP